MPLEALPRSGGTLILRISDSRDWRDPRCAGVRVTVGDTGSGVARHDLGKLFSGTFTSKGAKGNGVGLWMAKRFIESHGGSIHVRSRVHPRSS